jgi:hypothetical protein
MNRTTRLGKQPPLGRGIIRAAPICQKRAAVPHAFTRFGAILFMVDAPKPVPSPSKDGAVGED